ncbi:MAG: UDP-2,3-diacylglucosamine diphosphatase LpxI [Alphaproteobacteria bacterium]
MPKLGILAGGGELPARLVAACRSSGRPFYVLAFEGHTDRQLVEGVPHGWIRLGALGEGLRLLHAEAVDELVLAGRVTRPALSELVPDLRGLKFLAKVGASALGDDGILRAVTEELEAEGFRLVGPESILGDLVAPEGPYTTARPDAAALEDIARGIEVAKGLGRLDVGQAVVVQAGIVLGVEAIEGTDALLARCAGLKRKAPGGVLVKMRKPMQDSRVDLPTIGVETVRGAAAAGLRGIAIEAGGALVLDRPAVAAAADAAGLFVVGVTA